MSGISTGGGTSGADAQLGTITNDNAGTGYVGEVVTSTVAVGSTVSLTTATSANITSISLTAGDWDIDSSVDFVLTSVSGTVYKIGPGLTSATLPTQAGGSGLGTDALAQQMLITTTTSGTNSLSTTTVRLSIAATTTVYLVAQGTFSAGTLTGYGTIRARRMR